MLGLTEEQIFYFVVIILGLPLILFSLKFGAFLTLPKFILKSSFMMNYNIKRKKIEKRKAREEKKQKR